MTNDQLIAAATAVLNPVEVNNRLFGDVGAAVLTDTGDLFTGVSVDTAGWGLCAERSAIAAMITARQYRVAKMVAVWRNQQSGGLHVLPPCGICREFMRCVDESNLEAEVVLSPTRVAKLKTLLPFHEWPGPMGIEGAH